LQLFCLDQSEIIQTKAGVQRPYSNCIPQDNERVTSVCIAKHPCMDIQ